MGRKLDNLSLMLVIIPILLTYIVGDFIPGNNNLGIKYQLIIALSIPFIGLLMAIFAILKKPENRGNQRWLLQFL